MTIYLLVQYELSLSESIWFCTYIISLFICVILHELGHALSARRYNVVTKDIIISPIGGLARLESIPKQPLQEFVIAIAGPLVNLVLAAILLLVSLVLFGKPLSYLFQEFQMAESGSEFVRTLFAMNIVLFLFNLIPAFPMDGGRILRSLLSFKLGSYKATIYATLIGKIFAVFFVIFGVMYGQYAVIAIAIFVFYMAHIEYRQVAVEHTLRTQVIATIANKNFTRLSFSDPMSKVYDIHGQGGESSFLVFDLDGKPVASLPNLFIQDAKKDDANRDHSVAEFVSTHWAIVSSEASILEVRTQMQEQGLSIVGVMEDQHLVSVVDRESILLYMNSV